MLYNFREAPRDLHARMHLNRDLHAETGARIWGFPMRYQPVDRLDRSFVGPGWTWYQLRAFQIMLHGTHGAVSSADEYFDAAYGADEAEFEQLLRLPLAFIWHRRHYLHGAGRAVRDEFEAAWRATGKLERAQLFEILDGARGRPSLRERCTTAIASRTTPAAVRRLLPCYLLDATGPRTETADAALARDLRAGIAIPDAEFDGAPTG